MDIFPNRQPYPLPELALVINRPNRPHRRWYIRCLPEKVQFSQYPLAIILHSPPRLHSIILLFFEWLDAVAGNLNQADLPHRTIAL